MLNHFRNRLLHRLKLRESWVIFFVMGIIMMNFPFLGIFNKPDMIFGFPLMFLYLFIGWPISIFVIYLFALSVSHSNTANHETQQ